MMEGLRENSSLLWWILGLALGGLLIMIIVALLTNYSVKKALKKKTPKVPEAPPLPKKPSLTKMPPPYGRLSEYLSLQGFFKVGELSLSFLRAIQFLREHVGGVTPMYHLPWYLLIGAADSGKSELIKKSGVNLPVGEQLFGIEGKPDCKWWFLDKGILLDIRGNFFINHHNDKSNEMGWKSLLTLLARYRAKRPIDGMILTIPATEFIGKETLTFEQLKERAKMMADKIHEAQQGLGLMLPIYLVVTKMDYVPGFRSLCKEIPQKNKRDIFGWSNPYAVTTAYNKIWLEQAFGYMRQFLEHLRLEIFAEKDVDETKDGIFVFPTQMIGLKEGLSVYIDQIFRDSAYEETIFLRGIYFAGDGTDHSITDHPSTANIKELDDKHVGGEREIFFVKDLLEKKIFSETGLAQPMRKRAAAANRNLRIAKITTASLVTVSTFGVMHTYDRFVSQNEDILPILSKINLVLNQLQHVKGADSSQTVALFDSYAKQLIQMMHALSGSNFSSIFIPASWFSPIQDQLNHSIQISYNHIILRTIYVDLLLKGRELLYLRPGLENRSKSLAELIQPVASKEFAFLKDYVTRINELAHMVTLFNDLTKSNEISPLRELVRYTFKSELPKAFEEEFHNFRRVLRDVPFPPIDLEPYEVLAQDTLQIAYKFFLDGVLSLTDPQSIIGRLNLFLWQYSNKAAESLPNINELRQLAAELDHAVPKLGMSGKTWMDGDYFDGGEEFISIIGVVHDSPILGGKQMVEQIASDTGVAFNQFKQEMLRLLPILSEEAVVNPLADIKTQNVPSMVLVNLNKSLGSLFKESFMAPPPNNQFITVVPDQKIVFWDAKLVDAADKMVKKFEEFKTKNSLSLPSVVRESVILLAQGNMQANILATLARAEVFVDAPTGIPMGIAAEEIMRSKISNIKEVAPKFTTLLVTLNEGGAGASFVGVRNLLSHLAMHLLEQIEKAAMNNPPYAIKGNSFAWWDGLQGGVYKAFNVADMDELRGYFTLQHDRMKNWALNYAKYLVDFLKADIMKDSGFNRNLVDRWERIIHQVLLADEKKPDNSISNLENDLIKLNDLTFQTCFSEIKLKDVKESSGDFFVAVSRMVSREMLARCEVMARTESVKHYKELADFFNERLKDRYPFASSAKTNKGEADPSDLREFFRMYKEYGNAPEAILTQIAELGHMAAEPVAFLKAMHKIKEFFAEFVQSDDGSLPSLNLTVDFRVNKHNEQGANYIVEWSFKPNDATKIDQHEKDRSGKWTYGDPVEFGFRWPEGINVAPTLDEGQRYMSVEDNTAKFTFTSNWSILWLLQNYAQPKPSVAEPTPYLMKFVIPLGPEKKAIAFTQLTIRGPAKGKAPGHVLDLPFFPSQAPSMPDEVKKIEDEPVITKGKVKTVKVEKTKPEEKVEKKKEDKKDDKKKPEDAGDDGGEE